MIDLAPDEPAAELIVARYGTGALLPFQVRPTMARFLDEASGVVIVYARALRTNVVLGDPIGPDGDHGSAVEAFLRHAREDRRVVAVYQASAQSRQALRSAGLRRVFMIGQEAQIDLSDFSLSGSRRANLRHTVTRFGRDGGSVTWFPAGLDDDGFARFGPALAAIDAAWRQRAGPALGFTIGSYEQAAVRSAPIAIATEGSGEPAAFVTFRSTGADGGAVLDLIRRRPGGVPGAAEACIATAAAGFRDSGLTRLSLGLAPIHGLRVDAGPPEERLIRRAAEAVSRWYDIDGLAFFKTKFDPTWVPRYLAIRHRRDVVAAALALLVLHLAADGSVATAARAVVGKRQRSVPGTA